ncbi:MAG TPA: endonuclease domain-containing protein [Thermoanaerobaculia bacterium]|nr:endonuclease domain-containing protein [Thermoanaerobaculia bacterium]
MARREFLAPAPGKPRTERSRARILRETPTSAEKVMWTILRDRRLGRIKFRRQAPIGIYVADFYSHSLKLVVELDGEVHDNPRQAAHDENRDFYLRSLGCTVLRFPNREVFENRDAVLTQILEVAARLQTFL